MFTLDVFCDTELYEMVELCSRDGLDIASPLVVTLGYSALLLLWSPGTELFKLVEFYLGDGLEMARHFAMTFGRDSAQPLLIHIMVLKCLCVQLDKYLYYRGHPNDWTRKWSRKKIICFI